MWVKNALIFLILLSSTGLAASVDVFTSPENSLGAITNFLEGAESVKIASYTFTSPEIASSLIELRQKGSDIAILLEGSPVSGLPDKDILCGLQKNNITIMLYNGSFRFMHAKYIIKEDINGKEVLISTENFGTTGYPADSYGNRGWGVVVKDNEIASQFNDLFDDDMLDSMPLECESSDYMFQIEKIEYEPVTYNDQEVYTIFAPDAVQDMLNLIETAQDSIYLEQFYIYSYWGNKKDGYRDNLLLQAVIDKARLGLDVKVLLDSYWYNVDKEDPTSNYYTVEYLNDLAENEGLSLEAKLADLSNYEKIHTKGMIIDDSVFVSSINWNENSPRNNREVGVVITGEAANYFKDAFMQAWDGTTTNGKTGLAVADDSSVIIGIVVIVIIVVVLVVWKR